MQRSNAILSVMLLTIAAAGCQNLPAQKVNVRSASQTDAMADQVATVQPGSKQVNVTAKCDNVGAVTVTVAPWVVRLLEEDSTIIWNTQPGVDSVEVRAFDSRIWPFTALSFGAPGGEKFSRTVPKSAPGGTYHYVLRIFCSGKVIVIDPDIMVSRKQ